MSTSKALVFQGYQVATMTAVSSNPQEHIVGQVREVYQLTFDVMACQSFALVSDDAAS